MHGSDETDALMRIQPVIPVLTVERPGDAAPLAQALVYGGLSVIEVTLRTAAAFDVIAEMSSVPGARIGAGTILSTGDVDRAIRAGAEFLVTPGLSDSTVRAAFEQATPILPGVATPSEIMAGLELGLTRFKFFPAEQSGGVAMLKALAGPFGGVKFCPTGGISAKSAPAYLALSNVVCVGGGWVAPHGLIAAQDWAGVTALAHAAAALHRPEQPPAP